MKATLIVVADQSRARIFKADATASAVALKTAEAVLLLKGGEQQFYLCSTCWFPILHSS